MRFPWVRRTSLDEARAAILRVQDDRDRYRKKAETLGVLEDLMHEVGVVSVECVRRDKEKLFLITLLNGNTRAVSADVIGRWP